MVYVIAACLLILMNSFRDCSEHISSPGTWESVIGTSSSIRVGTPSEKLTYQNVLIKLIDISIHFYLCLILKLNVQFYLLLLAHQEKYFFFQVKP